MSRAQVVLKSGKEASIYRFHPWIFSGAIKQVTGEPKEGDLVEVLSNHQEFLALGHYQIGSISVRLIAFENVEIDHTFWKKAISSAYQMRKECGIIQANQTTIYRLIHGEGDGFPGLVVDVYNDTAIMQFHSVGLYRIKEQLADVLLEVVDGLTAIYEKSESTMPSKAPVQVKDGFIRGESQAQFAFENGFKFYIDWFTGQKTGFFIDQRDNRNLLSQFSKGKKVLNMFGYTGGFSVYALAAGAQLVHTVDASAKAIELTEQNIKANFPESDKHLGVSEDAFSYLSKHKGVYDLVILDPPAFAKHLSSLDKALQGYKRLNQVAMENMPANSVLFTFSCSQVVSKEQFRKSVFAAAANAKRKVRILHQLTQPADHPVSIFHPEGEYLKGLVLYIE